MSAYKSPHPKYKSNYLCTKKKKNRYSPPLDWIEMNLIVQDD